MGEVVRYADQNGSSRAKIDDHGMSVMPKQMAEWWTSPSSPRFASDT